MLHPHTTTLNLHNLAVLVLVRVPSDLPQTWITTAFPRKDGSWRDTKNSQHPDGRLQMPNSRFRKQSAQRLNLHMRNTVVPWPWCCALYPSLKKLKIQTSEETCPTQDLGQGAGTFGFWGRKLKGYT